MYVKSIVKNEKKRQVVEMYGRLYFDMDVQMHMCHLVALDIRIPGRSKYADMCLYPQLLKKLQQNFLDVGVKNQSVQHR